MATADGDAARFSQLLTEYKKAPQVTRDRLYIETMQQVLRNSSKLVIDSSSKSLLYLPVDRLMDGRAAQSSATDAAAQAAQAASTALEYGQSVSRSRDREAVRFGRDRDLGR
ncbi:MAG: hypothetical protein R3E83_19530 [Burkholderiaceae bacterium]